MSVEVIDTLFDGTAHYQALVNLDGVEFRLQLDWNVRDEHWYMTLSLLSGELVDGCVNVKLVQNWSAMRLSTSAKRPAGQFIVASAGHAEPGLFDLGQGTKLFYISAESVPEYFA